jgi:hypothetical protein
MKKINFSLNCKKISNKLWLLSLLSSGTLFNYSILALIDPTRAIAGDLEFDVGSYTTITNGPTTATQTGTLRNNTVDSVTSGGSFATYTPTITMSAAFSSQTYTNGLTFGGGVNSTSTAITPFAVFSKMNTFGSPTNNMFTSTANSTAGTGISVIDNYGFEMFASVQPLFTNNLSKNGRYYYGDLTLTFSRPVSDPVIQMGGLGGSFNSNTNLPVTSATLHGHTAEFELQETTITASKLSGVNLSVASNKITNSASTNNGLTYNSTCTANVASPIPGAACGSVKFAGTNITTLTFKVYVQGDSGGTGWSSSTTNNGDSFMFGGASIALPVTVSGTVFKDANGLTDSLVNGSGTNAGGLSANLVDGNNKVVATSIVSATDGTYSFLAIGAGSYTVFLSTIPGVQGLTAPTISLPTNWVNTGEGTTAAGDGTVDGKTAITVGTAAVSGINFGIDQLPDTTNLTPASQLNPGLAVTVLVPPLAGTDPEDGALGAGKSFRIVTLPTNGTLYYLNALNVPVAVTAGQLISNYDSTKLKLDPNDGAITVTFTYAAVDAAGKEDPTPATVTMPFTAPVSAISITGTIWNDKDNTGAVSPYTNIQTNGEGGTNAIFGTTTTAVNAILVNTLTGLVIDSQVVSSTGTYTFGNVPTGIGVQVILSPTAGTLLAAPPAGAAPAGWVKTAPLAVSVTTDVTSVSGVDFGIRQKAKLVLVKRITKINTTTFTDITTDTWNSGVAHWPAGYLLGKADAGLVKPGDTIEYTIYFLNNQGADAKNIKICDPIRGGQNYLPGSISLNLTSDPTAIGTTLSDTSPRINVFTGNVVPPNCNMGAATSIGASNGGVAIDITGATAATNQPVSIPGATSAAPPGNDNTYGLFRFRTQVKP